VKIFVKMPDGTSKWMEVPNAVAVILPGLEEWKWFATPVIHQNCQGFSDRWTISEESTGFAFPLTEEPTPLDALICALQLIKKHGLPIEKVRDGVARANRLIRGGVTR